MSNIRFLRHRVAAARDTLAWHIENAAPAIWPQAIRDVRTAQTYLTRLRAEQGLGSSQYPRGPDGGIVGSDYFHCLVTALNSRREKRKPTPREEAELRALVAEFHDADGYRHEALASAVADPEWALFYYRNLVAKHAAPRRPR